MNKINFKSFENLDYDSFAQRAADSRLSKYEKIGFPDSYRQDFEGTIFKDILRKLPALGEHEKSVMDIGAGCSDLPKLIMDHSQAKDHQLYLVDSQAMLDLLPDQPKTTKLAGYFPSKDLHLDLIGQMDVIICYSVFQYIHADGKGKAFLVQCNQLLAEGGSLLIGDLPNVDKRKRFLSSERGIAFHKAFMKTDEPPDVSGNPPAGSIDDEVIVNIIAKARQMGLDAYVLPQADDLPMANRREDILIHKP